VIEVGFAAGSRARITGAVEASLRGFRLALVCLGDFPSTHVIIKALFNEPIAAGRAWESGSEDSRCLGALDESVAGLLVHDRGRQQPARVR
jgi:hypothetical protein